MFAQTDQFFGMVNVYDNSLSSFQRNLYLTGIYLFISNIINLITISKYIDLTTHRIYNRLIARILLDIYVKNMIYSLLQSSYNKMYCDFYRRIKECPSVGSLQAMFLTDY